MNGVRLAGAAVVTLIACAPGPQPCITPGTCPEGEECLANRCVTLGSQPVDLATRRLVALPSAIAVVSAESTAEVLPSVVTFGARVDGAAALYLRFQPIWRRARTVDSAFLLLEPMPGTAPDAEEVPVDAFRIASDWDPERVARSTRPRLALPTARGLARSSPPVTLRIDVTSIVRHLKDHPRSAHGIALKAAGSAAHGASYATGASGGRGPRLEIYVR